MGKAGVPIGPNEQVHHIVPSTHPEAERARRILEKFGIDINEACNGVPIPKDLHYGQRLHSKAGIQWVTNQLGSATTPEQVMGILREIAAQIRSGRIPKL